MESIAVGVTVAALMLLVFLTVMAFTPVPKRQCPRCASYRFRGPTPDEIGCYCYECDKYFL